MWWLILYGVGLLIVLLAACRVFYCVTSGRHEIKQDWTGKTVVITGANSGIGLETVKFLGEAGASIVMLCRSVERAKESIKELSIKPKIIKCDVSSLKSVREAAEEVLESCPQIHVLVNNAGIGGSEHATTGEKKVTEDGLEMVMASNHLGHFLLTHLLLPRLKETGHARIINVSSLMHMFSDEEFSGENLNYDVAYNPKNLYANSKLAQILFTKALAKRLENTDITVNVLHPGVVKTNIWFKSKPWLRMIMLYLTTFAKTAAEGAQTTVFLADSDSVRHVSGQYFADCAPKATSLKAMDTALCEEVFQKSCELTGIEAFD